ncbi:MAG: nucleoside triphosphate pyrophosphohydrolase [Ruminococcaceae bacterium]|nr:nucleoside triphosphate pyrophosphohydrolase [Oscillospiraceae bacterium]
MVDYQYKNFYTVQDLMDIVRILRGPGGCPWDQVQTHESIRRDLLEEAYELVEAIDRHDPANLKEELGDVLLQVAFHTVLEDEQGSMTLDDVADGVCKKLIYRHPHVFGEVTVSGTEEVLTNWEKLKQVEKDQKSAADTLEAVARALPALWRAEKVQKKAQKAGFSQPDPVALKEELARHVQSLDGENGQQALGELLFAAVNLARQQQIDPEVALNEVTDRFIGEFRKREA